VPEDGSSKVEFVGSTKSIIVRKSKQKRKQRAKKKPGVILGDTSVSSVLSEMVEQDRIQRATWLIIIHAHFFSSPECCTEKKLRKIIIPLAEEYVMQGVRTKT